MSVDHRRTVSFAPGDLFSFIRASWADSPEHRLYVETVHRLSAFGAVVTKAIAERRHEGFDAEWREDLRLLTVEGTGNRLEIFDEGDLDAALARFDELSRSAPGLENAATGVWTRLADAFHRRDVDAFVDLTEPGGQLDDRRKGFRVSLDGSMRRRVVQTLFELPQSWQMELERRPRGSRLSLSRQLYRDSDQTDRPITVEGLTLTGCSDE